MDNGTYQGSYALITSDVLQYAFSQLQNSQLQNGLGLQTFAYFSGVPCEDSESTGLNPAFADAVVLSYVSYSGNGPFYADTIHDYNNYDSTYNKIREPRGYHTVGNQNIGIIVGGNTYLPRNFPIFMYEYGWASVGSGCTGPGPGCSSGYYVGILQYNSLKGWGYFLTTQYISNSNPTFNVYYDYYYSGSANGGSNYYFLEDNNSNGNNNIQGYNGGSNYFPFMPLDQQQNQLFDQPYSQYGLFWLYNWFQAGNGNMNIYFLMNGNIFNYSLASVNYNVNGQQTYIIPPNPPANTINGEPIFVQSYINAYNTAFNQETSNFNQNYQKALNKYSYFTYGDVNGNFVLGTFGYKEEYNSISNSQSNIIIAPLEDSASVYNGNPYLFISAGSGGGSGYMYLDWVIVTYGVPYVVSVS